MTDKKSSMLNTCILVVALMFIAMYISGAVYAAMQTNKTANGEGSLVQPTTGQSTDDSKKPLQQSTITQDVQPGTSTNTQIQQSQHSNNNQDREDD